MAISGAVTTLGGRRARRLGTTPATTAAPARPVLGMSRREDQLVFLVTAVPLIALGLYAALHLAIYQADALARGFSAMEVVRGFEPKLANLDLAWPPLPGLLLLPIAWLLPNVTAAGGGAPILSALSSGVCAVVLNRLLAPRVPNQGLRYALIATLFANPLLLGLAISGLTEMTALIFVLLLFAAIDRLGEGDQSIIPLVAMGVAAGALIVSRFEAAVLVLLIGLLLVGICWRKRDPAGRHYVSALTLIYATPIAYAAGVLIFLCATITGNPIYFLTGPGSNGDYTRVIVDATPLLARLVGHPLSTLGYLLRVTVAVAPLMLLALPVAAVIAVRRRDMTLASLVVMSLALPAVQFGLLLAGQSAGWSRYLFMDAALLLPVLVWCATRRAADGSVRQLSPLVTIALLGLLLGNDALAWTRLPDHAVRSDLRSSTGSTNYLTTAFGLHDATRYDPQITAEQGIAAALRNGLFVREPNALVLVDSSQATRIVLFSRRQDRFVTQDVIAFEQILADPGATVDYLLVPDTLPARNLILQAYPGIFDGIYSNLTLVGEFDGVFVDAGNTFYRWGLFRVSDAGTPAVGGGG